RAQPLLSLLLPYTTLFRSWRLETLEHGGLVGTHSSLAVDPAGSPAISYQEKLGWNTGLRLASWNGSAWVTERIDGPDWLGSGSSDRKSTRLNSSHEWISSA